MSSYHPNQDPSLLQINVGNLPLYIGDEQGIVAAIADSEGFSYSLEESEYPGTNLTKSTFDVTANDTEYAQEWVYDGNIFHRPEVKVDPKRYFEILGNLVADDDELTIEKTHLDSIYMIGSIGLNECARIAYYKNMSRVNYSNSAEDIGTGYYSSTSFSVKPRPVTSEVASSQLRVQLKGYYFALNALSVAVNSHEIKHVRKFTPQGSEVFDRPMQTFPTRDNLPAVIEKPKLEPAQVIKEKLMLDSLSGNEQLKRQLQHVVLSFKNPDIMKKWGAQRPQGVLLHGPAGTGKTSFAQAAANEIGGELWVIDSTKIYKKWLGESEQQMKNLFRAAKNKTDPTVMLFDEFDSIITHTDDTSGGSRAAN
ncbi:ATP-binding protein, partial [Candidatus Saccharibacteria bacterium]|nr:ATP-binding protein [Candidatus Saccharibacteria bacterium]